ncbi:hypothetical protein GZH47_32960 (plasmid) [Paenibacillus rhizovicinus]|uniref:Uncharacterized protein n=1 Tax=Paenibacillus rhizovicinus TaxID=2704463 RepID=A0A6C0PBH2_9BACL|nr:hypothetical protein [Paenibacillus rhizovicinus]QHW35705.1 hypothetical protein GZH47_32960 [Paenibacillus rhizovicinus]
MELATAYLEHRYDLVTDCYIASGMVIEFIYIQVFEGEAVRGVYEGMNDDGYVMVYDGEGTEFFELAKIVFAENVGWP